jgi:adenosyl cobinamide kinase/adenosyl cobinamide phosphate guanylyltransferase
VKNRHPQSEWHSAYEGDRLVPDSFTLQSRVLVLEGLEEWIKQCISDRKPEEFRSNWRNILREWQQWEQMDSGRHVIFIGTDITKGIVPMEKENRIWRDMTGWVYQDLAACCERVDVIWYGLNQTIKGDGE